MKVNKASAIPLYIQIANDIRQLIRLGYYPAGKRISIRKIAAEYEVSRGVADNAASTLESGGLVEVRPKSGIIVKGNAWCRMMNAVPNWSKLSENGVHQSNRMPLKAFIDRNSAPGITNVSYYGFNDKEFDSYAPLKKVLPKLSDPKFTAKFNTLDKRGLLELRQAVSQRLSGQGIDADPENIVIFNSWVAAMNTVVYALLSRGSNFYAADHDNVTIMKRVMSTGANIYHIPADKEGMSAAELQKKINPKNNNLLYLNPVNHFPTGKTISAARRSELLEHIHGGQIPVLENDILRDLWITPPPPPFKKEDKNEQIIYTGTFANTFNTAIHMAWVAAPSVIVERLCDVKIQLYGLMHQVPEILSFLMLDTGVYDNWIIETRKKMPARVDAINGMLEKHMTGLVRWEPQNLLYHIWLSFDKDFSSEKLFTDCKDILFMPGSSHYDNSSILLNAVTATLEELEYAIKTIAEKAKIQLS